MKQMTKCVALVAALVLSNAAFGQERETTVKPMPAAQLSTMTIRPALARMGAADEAKLKAMVAQHQRVRSQLPANDQSELDQLTELVKRQLFAAPIPADLLTATAQIVSKIAPRLSKPDATSLAEYVLGRIAAGGVVGSADSRSVGSMTTATSTQTAQMSFNLQYLQLQSQMQSENRAYTAVSNIMKTKHDTIKNSIGNVR